jgi:hypothetical protein
VNEHFSHPVETEKNKASLVERLDPSIGELSTVMGGMMTELLRRTLRDSIRQIDDELQGQVAQKLDATIAHRLPAIEKSAANAAEKTARETATDVAAAEARALEQRAKEAEREIVSRIERTARAAEQQTVETANTLTGKIELVEKKAELAITSKAHELNNRIEETAKTATTMTEEKARELAGQIEEAERRAAGTAQAEMTRQIEEVLQRSRKVTGGIMDRLQALEAARRTAEDHLRVELADVRKRNETLEARVIELEKPRGLRALWAWLFGRRKKNAKEPTPEADNTDDARPSADGKVPVPNSGEQKKTERKGVGRIVGKGS